MDISKKPAGETRDSAAIRFPSPVIAKPCNGCGNPFSFKGITDSFTLRAQNDKPFSHCGAGVRWTPLRSRSTDRAGRRDRRKVRGNPFLFLGVLRILSRFAFRMTGYLVIAKPCKRLWQSVFPFQTVISRKKPPVRRFFNFSLNLRRKYRYFRHLSGAKRRIGKHRR